MKIGLCYEVSCRFPSADNFIGEKVLTDVLRTAMFGDFQGMAPGASCCVERENIKTE